MYTYVYTRTHCLVPRLSLMLGQGDCLPTHTFARTHGEGKHIYIYIFIPEHS